jgi:outer membrane lipoprotein LolB
VSAFNFPLLRFDRLAITFLVLLLAGCAAQRLRPDSGLLSLQDQRERTLSADSTWALSGRLAVSSPDDGGSGSVEWQQDDEGFRVTMNAPVTGKTWILTGNFDHAEIVGLRNGAVSGRNAAELLERELGWQVPVLELTSWVRAIRSEGEADVVFRADGLPAQFIQSGWKIEYLDYDMTQQPPLPKKIFASRQGYKVRLIVQRWHAE